MGFVGSLNPSNHFCKRRKIMAQKSDGATKNIVLVHGGFVDGSGWEDVYQILNRDGYNVSVVQNPTISLTGDVAATRAVLDTQDGPAVLVGHSYGGVVITEAGNHASVDTLVYITAFAPDAGESVGTLIANPAPGAPVPPILPPVDGFLMLDIAKFAESFAGDVPLAKAEFMANSQVPWGLDALNGAVTTPAWKTKPSWYLVVTEDKMIPPPAQQFMSRRAGSTVREVGGTPSTYLNLRPLRTSSKKPQPGVQRPKRKRPNKSWLCRLSKGWQRVNARSERVIRYSKVRTD
jgi:pimeloyl-ACP methyl ester carboxylesterase